MNPQHARPPFSLLAYGSNQACRLAGRTEHQAELISIGARGAHVRLFDQAEGLLRFGESCLLDLDIAAGGQPLGRIPCAVAWTNGREAGLDFHDRFEASILNLQQAIIRAPLAREEAA